MLTLNGDNHIGFVCSSVIRELLELLAILEALGIERAS